MLGWASYLVLHACVHHELALSGFLTNNFFVDVINLESLSTCGRWPVFKATIASCVREKTQYSRALEVATSAKTCTRIPRRNAMVANFDFEPSFLSLIDTLRRNLNYGKDRPITKKLFRHRRFTITFRSVRCNGKNFRLIVPLHLLLRNSRHSHSGIYLSKSLDVFLDLQKRAGTWKAVAFFMCTTSVLYLHSLQWGRSKGRQFLFSSLDRDIKHYGKTASYSSLRVTSNFSTAPFIVNTVYAAGRFFVFLIQAPQCLFWHSKANCSSKNSLYSIFYVIWCARVQSRHDFFLI